MTIKSLFIAFGISISGLSAAEAIQPDALDRLVAGLENGTKTEVDVRLHIKELQATIYDLFDRGELAKAEKYLDSEEDRLSVTFEGMSDEDRWRSGAETLSLIGDYLHLHKKN